MAHDAVPGPASLEDALDRLLHLEHQLGQIRRFLGGRGRAQRGDASGVPPPGPPAERDEARGRWEVVGLGRFRLRCDGREVPLCPSRRGQAILQLLLARPGYAASPEVLIEAFWPEARRSAGARNVQAAVHALRASLRGCGPGGGDDALLFRSGEYLLNPSLVIEHDVDQFLAAYERGRRATVAGRPEEARPAYDRARALYGGGYLADSPYCDGWASNRRAGLQDVQLRILYEPSRLCSAAGDWEQAADCCHEILAADPYREDAYRQLMRCQAARGRFGDVQRTYRVCRDHLRRELQVTPAPE